MVWMQFEDTAKMCFPLNTLSKNVTLNGNVKYERNFSTAENLKVEE